jgi:hypothetical protein
MSASSRRTWLVGEEVDEETGRPRGHYDRERLLEVMEEVEHLLYMVGGQVAFVTDRVKTGEISGEMLAESRRVIVQWQAKGPLREEEEIDEHDSFAEPDVPEDDPELEAEPEPEEALTP